MIRIFTLGARVAFLHEKHNKPYTSYGDVSIVEKKVTIAQEAVQHSQLCWLATGSPQNLVLWGESGRAGV